MLVLPERHSQRGQVLPGNIIKIRRFHDTKVISCC